MSPFTDLFFQLLKFTFILLYMDKWQSKGVIKDYELSTEPAIVADIPLFNKLKLMPLFNE